MTPLAERVLVTVRRRELFAPGARVLVALSGGPDSVALLHVLHELSGAGFLQLAGVAHLDHGLRGDESKRDVEFCRELAGALGLPFETAALDVRAEMAREKRSLEEMARIVRYGFLEQARSRLGAECVAVGHTRDDQAETVLLRLLRGAGARGLAGIHPRAGAVVRPFLDVSREDVLHYLAGRGLPYVEDASNRDLARARNRVRHEVLPLLASRFGPSVPVVLARQADLARDDEALLEGLAAAAASRSLEVREGVVTLDLEALGREPASIARRLVRQGIERLGGPRPALVHVEGVLTWAAAGRPGGLDLPACRVELPASGGVLRFRRRGSPSHSGRSAWAHDLPIPGAVEVPEAGLRCLAIRRPAAGAGPAVAPSGGFSATLADTGIGPALVVRAWRPGDRLRPLGLGGHKKVQDLFVDRKVPRAERTRVPIVTDRDGRILWVAGHALAEPVRVTSATKSVVVLSFEPLGGPA